MYETQPSNQTRKRKPPANHNRYVSHHVGAGSKPARRPRRQPAQKPGPAEIRRAGHFHTIQKNRQAHSVRSATTGSFLAALLDGIRPEIRVSATLMATRMMAAGTGRTALRLSMPVTWCRIRLMGMHSR